MPETFVVVGGGVAAGKAVERLRDSGFTGEIALYTEEPHVPYERPPLSKGYLLGKDDLDAVFVNPAEWYEDNHVQLHLGDRVNSIDPGEHVIEADSGSRQYDRLLLATGARARALPFDAEQGPVTSLRTIEDSRRLKTQLTPGRRVVLIGGGWISLEVAAAARQADAEVTIVLPDALPLGSLLGPELAAVFAKLHRKHGVTFHAEVEAVGLRQGEDATYVQLSDGSEVPADLVVAAIGAQPNAELAEAAGLEVDNGIIVDATLASTDPDIFAAGDVANAMHPVLERRIRVDHWENAIAQGRLAADNMLGQSQHFEQLPYFFTDQYDLGMEYVGHVEPHSYDQLVIRGDMDALNFTAWWVTGRHVLAAMHVNDWDAIDDMRRIVGNEVALNALRDPATSLGELSAGA